LKEKNNKLSLSAIILNFIIVIVFSGIFLYLQTLPNNIIRKMNEPPIIVLLLISALPAAITIKSIMKLRTANRKLLK
jgi:predicted permease